MPPSPLNTATHIVRPSSNIFYHSMAISLYTHFSPFLLVCVSLLTSCSHLLHLSFALSLSLSYTLSFTLSLSLKHTHSLLSSHFATLSLSPSAFFLSGEWDFVYNDRKNRWLSELGMEDVKPRKRRSPGGDSIDYEKY